MNNAGRSSKGARFERMICVRLSLWVSGGSRKDLYWRTALSGGRATYYRRKKGEILIAGGGDVTAVAEEGYWLTNAFMIECKHWRTIGIESLTYGYKGNHGFTIIWSQLCEESEAVGKMPWIIARENNRPTLCGFDRVGQRLLGECVGARRLVWQPVLIIPRMDLYFFDMLDLLTSISPEKLKCVLGG